MKPPEMFEICYEGTAMRFSFHASGPFWKIWMKQSSELHWSPFGLMRQKNDGLLSFHNDIRSTSEHCDILVAYLVKCGWLNGYWSNKFNKGCLSHKGANDDYAHLMPEAERVTMKHVLLSVFAPPSYRKIIRDIEEAKEAERALAEADEEERRRNAIDGRFRQVSSILDLMILLLLFFCPLLFLSLLGF